jgi:hypothetical protein
MREGYEVYEAYIDGHEAEIEEGKDFVVEVRDLATFARLVVRAKISKDPQAMPEGGKLWVRAYNDEDVQGPWAIQILEELDDDQVQPIRGDVARGITPEPPKIY